MKFRFSLIFCLVYFCLSSCAYFNTFHNTKKFFNEAKKEREKRQGLKPSSKEIQKYNKTIEKASKILELYPNSKYVDDALMILGECFYYKGDYIKAQRKFKELITYFPQSDYSQMAKIWLAKTDIQLNDYLGAELVLKELQDSPKIKKELIQESRVLLGDILYEQGKYAEAEEKYKEVANNAKNKNIRAHAFNKLGQSQLKTHHYFDAIESFRNAIKNSPDKKFEFDAEMNLGIALKLAGDYQNSIKVCMSLLDNESFKNKHGLVKLELADCKYRAGKDLSDQLQGADLNYLGKVKEALNEYKNIIKEYKRTEVSANAYFQMGRIYEEDLGDLYKAKESYEKVKIEYNRSELIPEAKKKAKALGELIKLKNAIQKSQGLKVSENREESDKLTELEMLLLEQGVHPELRFLRKKRKLAKLAQASTSIVNSQEVEHNSGKNSQTVDEIIHYKMSLAELYLFQFAHIDSAITEYKEILNLFPNHPACAKALYSLAFIYENEYQNKTLTDSLLFELVKRFPNSFHAQEARKKLNLQLVTSQTNQAEELYKKAEQILFNENDVQRALAEYQKIIDKFPESEYAPKALYAMGWIYENKLSQNDKAAEIYREVLKKYPKTDFSKKVKKKIMALEKAAADEKASLKEKSQVLSLKDQDQEKKLKKEKKRIRP